MAAGRSAAVNKHSSQLSVFIATHHFSRAASWLNSSCQAYTRCSWAISSVRITPCGSRLRVPRAFSAAPMSLTAPSGRGLCKSIRSWSRHTLTVVGAQSMPAAASKEQGGTAFYIQWLLKGLAHMHSKRGNCCSFITDVTWFVYHTLQGPNKHCCPHVALRTPKDEPESRTAA
jgi:hypothetical protein